MIVDNVRDGLLGIEFNYIDYTKRICNTMNSN